VWVVRGAEAFDRGDLLPDAGGDGGDAGADRIAVEVDGAGAALRDAAAVFGAGKGCTFAKRPKQWDVGIQLNFQSDIID